MIGFPYISVPKRKIFAASQPRKTTVAARSTAETTTSTGETLPSAILANMAFPEVKGIKEATFINSISLSFIPVMVMMKDTTKIMVTGVADLLISSVFDTRAPSMPKRKAYKR